MTNFGWSYPAGVTGREFAIAGNDTEETESRFCGGDCQEDQDGLTCGYQGEYTWECSVCGWTEEWDAADEVDWDRIAEEAKEARLERRWLDD